MTRTGGSVETLRATPAVPSVEPFSTMRISASGAAAVTSATSSGSARGMKSASLKTGTTMETDLFNRPAILGRPRRGHTLRPSMRPDLVFKAYDIRGRTDNGDLDPELCELVGSALVDLLGADRIAVGRDVRTSSGPLFEGLARGITTAGADVIDLGEVPTDAIYYFSGSRGVPGAMITASHNPPVYNGIKLCRAG